MDTDGVTINPTEPFSNIVDCASNCKANPQNTMFAFETSKGCGDSDAKCQCHCIESVNKGCSTSEQQGFTLFKFQNEAYCTSFVIRLDGVWGRRRIGLHVESSPGKNQPPPNVIQKTPPAAIH